MKTDLTKTEILNAIKRLIKLYKTKKHQGVEGLCPLCQIYKIGDNCQTCPNVPFNKPHSYYPCLRRCDTYPDLDWDNEENRLEEYWTDIYKLLKSKTSFEVTTLHPELWPQIIQIAEKYKNW